MPFIEHSESQEYSSTAVLLSNRIAKENYWDEAIWLAGYCSDNFFGKIIDMKPCDWPTECTGNIVTQKDMWLAWYLKYAVILLDVSEMSE